MKAFTVGCGVIKISVFLKIQECFLGFSCILKEIGSRRKYSRQHLTEDLRLFGFSIVCVHHKWNGARLLPSEIQYTSYVMSGRTT